MKPTGSLLTYSQARNYLESLIPSPGGKHQGILRLERIKHLLKVLGNPQKKFRSVHVGGTSGKGSTALVLASILARAGYKTGLYRSPHLQIITERIQINGNFMPIKTFIQAVNQVRPLVEEVAKEGKFGPPTYFETLVAIAFEFFAREKVDVAVIEVGVGGKGDATNVIKPEVAIITNVGLDHMDILGKTLKEIAYQKSGIIKRNSTVICGATKKVAIEVIQKKCQEERAKLLLVNQDFKEKLRNIQKNGEIFNLKTPKRFYKNLKLSLLGKYQIDNASLAIVAAEELTKKGFKIDRKDIKEALQYIKFPGRMEVVQKKPLIVLDGAHNPEKIKALTLSLPKIFKFNKLIFVIGFKKNKDIKKMVKILSRVGDKFIITQAKVTNSKGEKISAEPKQIAVRFNKLNCFSAQDSHEAVKKALFLAGEKDLICITGSLYLVGEVRNIWFTNSFN